MYTCWACKGKKKCMECSGSGRTFSRIDRREIRCPLCSATGICNVCNGTGWSETQTPEEDMQKLGVPKKLIEQMSDSSIKYRESSKSEESDSSSGVVWGWAIGLGILLALWGGFGGFVAGAIIGVVIGLIIKNR